MREADPKNPSDPPSNRPPSPRAPLPSLLSRPYEHRRPTDTGRAPSGPSPFASVGVSTIPEADFQPRADMTPAGRPATRRENGYAPVSSGGVMHPTPYHHGQGQFHEGSQQQQRQHHHHSPLANYPTRYGNGRAPGVLAPTSYRAPSADPPFPPRARVPYNPPAARPGYAQPHPVPRQEYAAAEPVAPSFDVALRRQAPYPPTTPITIPRSAPAPPARARAAPATRSSADSFQGLVEHVLDHPSLALMVKKVLEAPNNGDVEVRGAEAELDSVNRQVRALANITAETGSVDQTCRTVETVDVFFAAMMTALETVKNNPDIDMPPALRSVIQTTGDLTQGAVDDASLQAAANKDTYPNIFEKPPPVAEEPTEPKTKIGSRARGILMRWFEDHFDNPYPSEEEKKRLAIECGIQTKQVNNYFGNIRMRTKRKAMALSAGKGVAVPVIPPISDPSQSVLAPKAKWNHFVMTEIPSAGAHRRLAEEEAGGGRSSSNGNGQRFNPDGSLQNSSGEGGGSSSGRRRQRRE